MSTLYHIVGVANSILNDFYCVGKRIIQFIRLYSNAFYSVGVELASEVFIFLNSTLRSIQKKHLFQSFPVEKSRLRQQATQILSVLKKIPTYNLSELESNFSSLQLVLIALGIFAAGCLWLIIMIYFIM